MIFRREDRKCLLALVAVAVGFHGRGLLNGAWPAYDDIVAQYWPWWTYAVESLRQFRFPLWNPHVAGGMPYMTNPENALYYPLKIPLLFLPFFPAVLVLRILNAIVASTGMFALLRGLRVARICAVAGGLMFAYGSFMSYEQVHIPYVNTAAWWPWEMLLIRMIFMRSGFRGAILLACVTGISFFGGSPGIFLIGHAALAFFAAFALLDAAVKRRFARCRRAVLRLAQAAVIFAGLTAVLWLPALEFTALSVRSGGLADLGSYERFAMPPEGLRALAFPWLHWLSGAPYFPLHPLPFVSIPYVGAAGVFLALNGLVSKRYFRFLAPVLALVPFAILMGMGARTGFAEMAMRLAPFLRWFRWPNDYFFILYAVISMAAALGLDVLWRPGRMAGLRLVAGSGLYLGAAVLLAPGIVSTAVFAAGMAAAAVVYVFSALSRGLQRPFRFKSQAWAFLIAVMMADLALFSAGYNLAVPAASLRKVAPARIVGWIRRHAGFDRVSAATTGWQLYFRGQERAGQGYLGMFEVPPAPLDRPLVEEAFRAVKPQLRSWNLWRRRLIFEDQERWSLTWPVNAAMLFGYQDVSVYDPFILKNVAELYQRVPVERLWNLMSVRYVARPSRIIMDGLEEVLEVPAGRIYENRNAFPRVWISRDIRDGIPHERVFETLADPSFDPRQTVLFEDCIPSLWKDALAGAGRVEGEEAGILEYRPESVMVQVQLAHPACLVFNDIFYPGWTARLEDGRMLKVWKACGVFRAVFLPAGKHTVEFRFEPWSWRAGVLASAASWVFAGVALCLAGRRGCWKKG